MTHALCPRARARARARRGGCLPRLAVRSAPLDRPLYMTVIYDRYMSASPSRSECSFGPTTRSRSSRFAMAACVSQEDRARLNHSEVSLFRGRARPSRFVRNGSVVSQWQRVFVASQPLTSKSTRVPWARARVLRVGPGRPLARRRDRRGRAAAGGHPPAHGTVTSTRDGCGGVVCYEARSF